MKLSRKHFEKMASLLGRALVGNRDRVEILGDFLVLLKDSNPAFDPQRFVVAVINATKEEKARARTKGDPSTENTLREALETMLDVPRPGFADYEARQNVARCKARAALGFVSP
jgi:hypothetical protein